MPAPLSSAVLRTVPLFSQLPEELLRTIAGAVQRRSVPRKAVVIAAGDPTDSLYIVVNGHLEVTVGNAEGKEVILTLLGPGEVFGEMALIDDQPRSATVVAREPCELLVLAKTAFRRLLADNFDLTLAVMRGLVKRLRDADRKIGTLALLDVYGRVARVLLDLAKEVDGQKRVTVRLAKKDIAKMIGASREMVSRVMRDLERSGYIATRGSTIILRDELPRPD